MGLEKIIGFLNKNLSYNGIKEVSVNNCCNKTITENVFFDFNFIIYSNLVNLENDINELLKILNSLPYVSIEVIEDKLDAILSLDYFKLVKEDICKIIDGDNENTIIKELKEFLFSKEKFIEYQKKYLPNCDFNDNIMLDFIFFTKIITYVDNMINNLHHIDFVKNTFIFLDGIPSYSKILEQKRRRTKNFLESKIRKEYFLKIFNNFKNDVYTENELSYNYFEWLNNKISLDKSFGPSSKIILDLEIFFKEINKSNKIINLSYNLNICSGRVMGESDFKIFKYIKKKKISGDIFIHTCDSDFVHLVLVQQIYNIIYQKKTKYNIIRYFSKDNTIVQYVNSYFIIKELMKIIKRIFNITESKYFILLDFLGLCYLFGNDHLPSNNWFGAEFSFEEIIILLKESYENEQGYMITFNKNKNITINWKIFLNFLKILKVKKNNLRFNLIRLHKNNGNYLYTNHLDLSLKEFTEEYVPKFLSYLGYLKTQDLEIDKSLLDKKYYWDSYFYNKLKTTTNPFNKFFSDEKLEKFSENLKNNLNNYRDECNMNYILKYQRPLELEENNYQNLYKYICDLASRKGSENYPNIFKTNSVDSDNNEEIVYNYLLIFYYMIKHFFKSIEDYNPFNLTHYKYVNAPSLDSLISYLNVNDLEKLSEKLENNINMNNIEPNNYFNNLSHHLFITPYLLKSDYLNKISSIDNIEEILLKLDSIDNLCIDETNYDFNFKQISPLTFLNKWKEINDNIINKK